jgi:hypothetical protein
MLTKAGFGIKGKHYFISLLYYSNKLGQQLVTSNIDDPNLSLTDL